MKTKNRMVSRQLIEAVEKAGRFPTRDSWINIGGWRMNATLPGELLVSIAAENC